MDVPKQEDGEKSVRSDLCKYKYRWLEGFLLRITPREMVHGQWLEGPKVGLQQI